MASEPAQSPPELPSFVENLISSRNRDISLFLPFILGLNSSPESPGGRPDRIVLINPFTQGMVVIERSSGGGDGDDGGSSLSFESLIDELLSRKSGRPPASKAAIDAMESVEVGGGDQCVICLEEWEAGERAKRMPCDHRFHGECIEKWLKIHGSCPVCRYEMPVEEAEEEKKRGGGGGGERRRGIWVSFTFGTERRRTAEDDDDASSERSRTSDDENVS